MKVFRIKPEKVDTLRAWTDEIQTKRREEAAVTLREEHCTHEIFELYEIDGAHFLVTHMEGDDIRPSNTNREINQKHRAILKECIAEQIKGETLYDIKADDPSA